MRILKGKVIYGSGTLEGKVVVSRRPISFLGDIDGVRGILKLDDEEISIYSKILIIPYSVGSTVGPYIMYQLYKYGKRPKAILTVRADTLLIIGSIIAEIALITDLPEDILNIPRDSYVKIDLNSGEVCILQE